jgi:hypothetical protein
MGRGPLALTAPLRFRHAAKACERFIDARIDAQQTDKRLWPSDDRHWETLWEALKDAEDECKRHGLMDAAKKSKIKQIKKKRQVVCDRRKVLASGRGDASQYRTGAPGRPTSRQLIEGEFDRRVAAGDVLSTLAAEAKHLESWLQLEHPDAPSMTARTIENTIRDKYQRHRNP